MWSVYVFIVCLMTLSTAKIMIAPNHDMIRKSWIVKDVEWSVVAGSVDNVAYFKVIFRHLHEGKKKERAIKYTR